MLCYQAPFHWRKRDGRCCHTLLIVVEGYVEVMVGNAIRGFICFATPFHPGTLAGPLDAVSTPPHLAELLSLPQSSCCSQYKRSRQKVSNRWQSYNPPLRDPPKEWKCIASITYDTLRCRYKSQQNPSDPCTRSRQTLKQHSDFPAKYEAPPYQHNHLPLPSTKSFHEFHSLHYTARHRA